MKMRRFSLGFTVVFGSFAALISFQTIHAGAATPPRVPPAAAQELPEGSGKAVVQKICTTCHGLDYLVPSERTVPVWRDTLDLMRGYGAEATEEQWKTITEYIIANLAYLNVNAATAEDIGLVFAVNEKIAQDVVAYREKQGAFKTIDDLKKAPDLDAQKVDALQARLLFE